MLIVFLTGLAVAVGVLLSVLLVWGVPIYFIQREQHVPEVERELWVIASVFFPWAAFLVFMLVAPLTTLRQH